MATAFHKLYKSDDKPRCPECGMDLTKHNIEGHIYYHWPEDWVKSVTNEDALDRIHVLQAMAKQGGK